MRPLFVYVLTSGYHCLCISLDDILIIDSSSMMVHKLIDFLHVKFALKKLDHPEYFLGIEIRQLSTWCLLLTHSKYICDLLVRANMNNANGVITPMLTGCRLSKHRASPFSEPHHYM